jgi:AcrR family transcriptional regulator
VSTGNNRLRRRERLSPEERRSALLREALSLAMESPLEQLSMDELARRSGVSRALAYHYFPSVDQLYVELFREGAARFVSKINRVVALPTQSRAVTGVRAFLDFYQELPVMVTLYRNPALGGVEMERAAERLRAYTIEGTAVALRAQRTPVFHAAMRAWLGSIEASIAEWSKTPVLARADLETLLVDSLFSLLLSAAEIDPTIGINPKGLRDAWRSSREMMGRSLPD